MSKKKWLLIIIAVIVLSWLLIPKFNPALGQSLDNLVGPTVTGLFTTIYTSITGSVVWQTWDVWISAIFFSALTALIMWQGHNAYNKIRQSAARSAVKEAYGYQAAPTAQPMTIPQAKSSTATPQPVAEPEKEQAPA